MNLTVIIPVAPRDLERVPKCLRTILYSVKDLQGRNGNDIGITRIKIIIDGPVGVPDDIAKTIGEAFDGLEFLNLEPFIKILEKPMGAAIARNFGLAMTPPRDLVCFMDADDEMYPWCLWTRVNAYDEWQTEGSDLREAFVYTQNVHRFVHPERPAEVMQQLRDLPHPVNVPTYIEKQNIFLTTSILCRAELLQNAGGFEPFMICGEDGCLWRRVVRMPGVDLVPVVLPTHTYTVRKDSQCRALHKANDRMFHLEPSVHGPMGQGLDDGAQMRGLLFQDSTSLPDRIKALCTELL